MFLQALVLVCLGIPLVSGNDVYYECPRGLGFYERYFRVFHNKCYHFVVHERMDFDDAKNYCVKNGGNLAVITSQVINDFIYTRLKYIFNLKGTAWIGLSDVETEDIFKWVDNTPLKYSNFAAGETDGYLKHYVEDCVAMDTNAQGQWRDYNCKASWWNMGTEKREFVCESPAIVRRQPSTWRPDDMSSTAQPSYGSATDGEVFPTPSSSQNTHFGEDSTPSSFQNTTFGEDSTPSSFQNTTFGEESTPSSFQNTTFGEFSSQPDSRNATV